MSLLFNALHTHPTIVIRPQTNPAYIKFSFSLGLLSVHSVHHLDVNLQLIQREQHPVSAVLAAA